MPKNAPPKISDSEWLIAETLWNEPGLSASEVAAALDPESHWKQKTVNTFLARLVAKGVLRTTAEGRGYRYWPVVERSQCVRAEARSFLDRVFRGAAAPMLQHFCESGDLTDDDLQKLRAILDERTKQGKPNKGRKS